MEQTTVPTAPSVWDVLSAEEDVADDLRKLGLLVDSTTPTGDQARRDALASYLLRRQAESIEAITQSERSCALEIQFIQSRYAPEIARHRERVKKIEAAVRAVAAETKERGGYPGKKKSRDCGAGTYGYKTYSPCVELRDEAAYATWAEEHAPDTLRVKPTLTLATAKEFLSETELAEVKREVVKAEASKRADSEKALPPGFVRIGESHDFYSKPLPAAAIAGAKV